MSETKLSRVRIEAVGPDPQKVSLYLTEIAGEIRGQAGGVWEEEEPGVSTAPTSRTDKTWGRLTIRRTDDSS